MRHGVYRETDGNEVWYEVYIQGVMIAVADTMGEANQLLAHFEYKRR